MKKAVHFEYVPEGETMHRCYVEVLKRLRFAVCRKEAKEISFL